MNKFQMMLEEKIVPACDKFTSNRYIKILMNSFMGITAFTIGGSFFQIIRSIPLGSWYTDFLINTGLYDILNFPISITSNLIAVYLIIALGYMTAKSFNKNPLNGAIVAMGAFLILTPQTGMVRSVDYTQTMMATGIIPTSAFGPQGMFLAILVGIFATRIYVWADDKNLKIKMPSSVPSNVSNMFEMMIPSVLVFIVFMFIRAACAATTFGTAQNLIFGVLQAPLSNVAGGFPGVFLYFVLPSLLWAIGIHGDMLMYVAMSSVVGVFNAENASAFAAGLAAPHPEWMLNNFVKIGGMGNAIALTVLMLLFAKSKQFKMLGKLSLPTSLFGISEPIIFGAPIVMNPILVIPFVLTTLFNFLVSYFVLIQAALIPGPTGAVTGSIMPIFLNQSLVTGDWTAIVFTAILIVMDILIYFPFFKAADKAKLKQELQSDDDSEDDD